MATKEEFEWAKVIGALLAIVILMCVWFACGKRLLQAVNGGEPPNHELRR